MRRQLRLLGAALYRLYEDSGFSMAGAIAFSFVLSIFPFCIFLGALAGYIGGPDLAHKAVDELFHAAPPAVAQVLSPEVMAVMGQSRVGLLTLGAGVALFFATSAIETLRASLNIAYREKETRSYPFCLLQSTLFVFASAAGLLAIAWGIVIGPNLAARVKSTAFHALVGDTHFAILSRYVAVCLITGAQLYLYHVWLAAGQRSWSQVWPGIMISIVLWLITGNLYSDYLSVYDYSRFYAGLSQLMGALFFFQVSGMIIILGAEFNRALLEVRAEERGEPLRPPAGA